MIIHTAVEKNVNMFFVNTVYDAAIEIYTCVYFKKIRLNQMLML